MNMGGKASSELLLDLAASLDMAAVLLRRPLDESLARQICGLVGEGEEGDDGFSTLVSWCRDALSAEGRLAEAKVEFHRLFVGPHHVVCPPWGSVYTENGQLFGSSSLRVAHLMESEGVEIPEGRTEPSDHFSYELAFLSKLIRDAASPGTDGQTSSVSFAHAVSFYETYMAPWCGRFLDGVESNDTSGLYVAVARFIRDLLYEWQEMIA